MPKIDMVSAKIMIAGDNRQIVHRDGIDAVSVPEIPILEFLHGADSVEVLEYVRTESRTLEDELGRLHSLYGDRAMTMCYPGSKPAVICEAAPDMKGKTKTRGRPPAKAEGQEAGIF